MTSDQPMLSPLAEQVRRADRDRFTAALFAPPEAREGLMALYALNLELAKVRESVRETMAGMIRLQWWREVLAGTREAEAAGHPVAAALVGLDLPADMVERLLVAREQDLQQAPFARMDDLVAYAGDTAGTLAELACHLLGGRAEAARDAGIAVALAGLARALPYHLSTGWLTLPEDRLRAAGTNPDAVLAGSAPKAALLAIVAEIGAIARDHLRRARRQPRDRAAIPALLPATIAGGHLDRMGRLGWDVFESRVALPRPMPVRLAVNALMGRF